jgi:hypothetical protein
MELVSDSVSLCFVLVPSRTCLLAHPARRASAHLPRLCSLAAPLPTCQASARSPCLCPLAAPLPARRVFCLRLLARMPFARRLSSSRSPALCFRLLRVSHPKYYRWDIQIRTRQKGIGNSSHGLRTAYRDRATDTRLGSTDSAAPEDPGPSTSADRKSASAAAEKDNLDGHHRKDKQSEGNGNARSCESRSRNRSGVVSRGTAQRNNTTSRESLYRCIVADSLEARGDTAAPRCQETRGIMLPLASLSLTPDYGDEPWALPAHGSVSVSPPIRGAYNGYDAGHTLH